MTSSTVTSDWAGTLCVDTFAFAPATAADLPLVAEVAASAYNHPWSLRHFQDSLHAGHLLHMLVGEPTHTDAPVPTLPDGRWLLGFFVAMQVVDEVHLLNITTAPAHQRQGWGGVMLDALALWARQQACHWLWLEVRASNRTARALYQKMGFHEVGVRRAYYPNGSLPREDAVVMNRSLETHVGSAP